MTRKIIVVGAGNAALCAAIAAAESGSEVLVLERAPRECRGGNSAFTGGAFRTVYNGTEDLCRLIPDLSDAEIEASDFGSYTAERFYDDLARLSSYRADPGLIDILVQESLPTLLWMKDHHVRFVPSFGRQSFKVNGRNIFWGGLTVETVGGGVGLMDALFRRAHDLGVAVRYDAKVTGLEGNHRFVSGVRLDEESIPADAVILAAGGFHASAEMRTRYLGPGWDLAKVRGSRFNTGNVMTAALAIGARSRGNWSDCHSVFFDAGAEEFGDIGVLNQQKNYFTLGIVVNQFGKRFIDEGRDFRNYTYSKMGAEVLKQPGGVAWQIFDAKVASLLPDEYRVPRAARFEAHSLEALARKLDGIDEDCFLRTLAEFNTAVDASKAFNPAIKDGRATRGLTPDKSNWANPISSPPFIAYQVSCGITLTYGGLAIDADARVENEEGEAIEGLFACGELVGGLYYDRYPGGAGLTSGAVFGRIAGRTASRSSLS